MTTKKLTDYIKQSISVQGTKKEEQPKPAQVRILFEKETELKETPIGKIPKEWKMSALSQLISYEKGKKPSELFKEEKNRHLIPYLKAEYLRGLEPPAWCEPTDVNVLRVKKTDIIMIWDGSYSGEVFIGFEGALASTMIKIIPKESLVNNRYLYYWLKKYNQILHSTTVGTGIPHVNKKIFENLLIPIPPLMEQKVIAEILSTVDSVIDRVRRLVERADKIKKGLMQELFTKGIGHKEYKETPIGKIPKEWKFNKLGNIAEIIMGQSPPSSTYNREGKGLPFLQGKMEFGRIYPSPTLYCSKPIKIAEPNDILISVRAPVGDVNIAPFKLCIGRGLAAIRFNPQKAIYWFYFYYLQKIKKFLENLSKGSTFKAITKDDLENLEIPVPPLSEQEIIAEILYTVDEYIRMLEARLEHLEHVKKWLMDVLLTGKVRVIVEPSSGGSSG
ncbi:MAG: restriction endonuclease subunit S [Nitrososphaerota archaeon]